MRLEICGVQIRNEDYIPEMSWVQVIQVERTVLIRDKQDLRIEMIELGSERIRFSKKK